MATFFRKSVKVGPMRLNLSKSGIGTSVGVKGLRVGVNSKGKGYTAGGAHGVYFRESLGSSGSHHSNSNTNFVTTEGGSAKGFGYFCYIISLFLSFFIPVLFILSIPLTIIVIISIINNSKIKKFKKEVMASIDNILENKEYQKLENIISKIPLTIKKEADRILFVLQIYGLIALAFVKDNEIDESEEKILQSIISLVSPDVLKGVNLVLVNGILKAAIEDKRISAEEENLISKCITLFQLFDAKEEINRVINDYKELEKIENSELKEIKPTLNINEKHPIYYENTFMLKKTKTEKGVQDIIDDCSGNILLSSHNLHLVTNGHKSIKLSNIISAELEEENIELVVTNRKTPIYFYINNPISFLGILKKVM